MARGPQVKIIEVNEYKKQSRRIRKPKERFAVRGKPMEIVPFMCHPVLPGESLDSCFLQDRVVSDPIAGKMQGWWQDYYIFYVPVRALVDQGADHAGRQLLRGAPHRHDAAGVGLAPHGPPA